MFKPVLAAVGLAYPDLRVGEHAQWNVGPLSISFTLKNRSGTTHQYYNIYFVTS